MRSAPWHVSTQSALNSLLGFDWWNCAARLTLLDWILYFMQEVNDEGIS